MEGNGRHHSSTIWVGEGLVHAQRRQIFVQRQARERLLFTLVLSMLAFNCCSCTRILWRKERSSYWWDHVLSQLLTGLRTFACLKQLFSVCSEIRPVIKKEDIVMRTAIPVEHRVALTLWFLATNLDYLPYNRAFVLCIIVAVMLETTQRQWLSAWISL